MNSFEKAAENPDEKSTRIMEKAKELVLPGEFDAISFDTKVSLTPAGKPDELQMTGSIPFEKLSEKGVKRAKQQGYSQGDIVTFAFSSKSANENLDIIRKNGGKCDVCGHILFEEDGMLVSFSFGVDSSNNPFHTINKVARQGNLAGVEPKIGKGTNYSYLVCNTDSCRKSIDEKIEDRIKNGNISEQKPSSDGCYIATATFGSPMAREVKTLYEFRDLILYQSKTGQRFVNFYYTISPLLSRVIRRNNLLKRISRIILGPVIFFAETQLKSRKEKK